MTNFLKTSDILCETQFGFQKGKSTADAVLKLTDEIYQSAKEKQICSAILLDLAKAFDTVDHSITPPSHSPTGTPYHWKLWPKNRPR